MASKEIPLSELLMQDPDPIVDLMSPLNSVDATSKDRMVIQEGTFGRESILAGYMVARIVLGSKSAPLLLIL